MKFLKSWCNFFILMLVVLKRGSHANPAEFTGFQRINSGCYQFFNTSTDYYTAKQTCNDLNTGATASMAKFHLLSLESETEVASLQLWFKGKNLTKNYWTNGVFELVSATSYTSAYYAPYWEWLDTEATFYNYWDHSGVSYANGYSVYLAYNTSQLYEYESDTTSANHEFICEASVLCTAATNQCQNNATCYINSGLILCDCTPGYYGSLCQNLYDECDSAPCLHGGTCTSSVNNYSCSCTEYYTGTNCDVAVDYSTLQKGRQAAVWTCVALVLGMMVGLMLADLPWVLFVTIIRKRLGIEAKPKEPIDKKTLINDALWESQPQGPSALSKTPTERRASSIRPLDDDRPESKRMSKREKLKSLLKRSQDDGSYYDRSVPSGADLVKVEEDVINKLRMTFRQPAASRTNTNPELFDRSRAVYSPY